MWMAKSTSLNLRISPEFRAEIETLAAFHGLSMSSYAHSLLVKAVRREKEEAPPEVFPLVRRENNVIATITSEKAEINRQFQQGIPLAPATKRPIPLPNAKNTQEKKKKAQ